MRGAFLINDQDMLDATGRMSTMMGCAEPLMAADAALVTLLSDSVETVLVPGPEPRLGLLAASGETPRT